MYVSYSSQGDTSYVLEPPLTPINFVSRVGYIFHLQVGAIGGLCKQAGALRCTCGLSPHTTDDTFESTRAWYR